jgi:hypothetical protein
MPIKRALRNDYSFHATVVTPGFLVILLPKDTAMAKIIFLL